MPGRGTVEAVFIVRYQSKGKKLFYVFVDLEKAFDRVPRKVIWYALRKSGVSEYLVQGVMSLCRCKTVVFVDGELSDFFFV